MKYFYCLASVLCIFVFAGCQEDMYRLVVEIKCPEKVDRSIAGKFRTEYVTEGWSSGDSVDKFEEPCVIDELLYSGDKRRALVFKNENMRMSQVFILDIPRNPDPMPWSEWKYPNYFFSGWNDAAANFMSGIYPRKREDIDKSQAYRIRYKLLKYPGIKYTVGMFRGEKYHMSIDEVIYGESLESIARGCKMTPQELRTLNNLPPGAELHEGERIILPLCKYDQPDQNK